MPVAPFPAAAPERAVARLHVEGLLGPIACSGRADGGLARAPPSRVTGTMRELAAGRDVESSRADGGSNVGMSASSCSRSKPSSPKPLSRTVSGSAGVSLSCLPSGPWPFFMPCLISVSPSGWRSLAADLRRRNEAKSDGIVSRGCWCLPPDLTGRFAARLLARVVGPSKSSYKAVSASVANRVFLGEDCGGPLDAKLPCCCSSGRRASGSKRSGVGGSAAEAGSKGVSV